MDKPHWCACSSPKLAIIFFYVNRKAGAANFIPTGPLLPVRARKLADRCHNPPTGATGSSARLYQGPTFVSCPILIFYVPAKRHGDCIYRAAIRSQAGDLCCLFSRNGPSYPKIFAKHQKYFSLYEQMAAENGLILIQPKLTKLEPCWPARRRGMVFKMEVPGQLTTFPRNGLSIKILYNNLKYLT
jgi:hypothetical protein